MNYNNLSFPWAAVLQEWLHHGFLSWGRLLGTDCSRVGPPWTLIPVKKKVIRCRLLSMVRSFFQEPHAEWAHRGVQLPSGRISVLQHGFLPRLQGRSLLWCGPPGAAGRQPASPWSPPQATEESLLQCLKHALLLLPPWPWCPWSCFIFSHLSLLRLLQGFFNRFQMGFHRGTTNFIDRLSFGQQWVQSGAR